MLKLGSFVLVKKEERDENESTCDWRETSAVSAAAGERVSADGDEAKMGRSVWVLRLQPMVAICSVRGREVGEALFGSFREGRRKEEAAIEVDWRRF